MTTHPTVLPASYGECPFDPPPAYRQNTSVTAAALPDGSSVWLVSGHREVRAVLADQRFSADARTPGFPFLSPGQRELATRKPSFIRMDDPEHGRLRKMVSRDFLIKRIEALRPGIQRIVDEAIDRMTDKGPPADLVEDFTLPVPSLVICLLLGVPYQDHEMFERLSRTLLDNSTSEERATEAHVELMTYLADLAAWKRDNPGEDILSQLAARDDLSPQETASLGFLLLITGHESTANQTAIAVLALLRHPEQLAALRADPALMPGAVEELLRYLTIIHFGLARAATEDIVVGGNLISRGDGVICMLSTANRDEQLFGPDPATLDITRDARRHVAFGFGVHQCLGLHLARAELRISLGSLLDRLPDMRLAVPYEDLTYHVDRIAYGVQSLPITWS